MLTVFESFSKKEIIIFITIFLFSLYKIFMKERVFRTNVNHKKVKEFIKFFNNKKNLKKRLPLENMILYRFNYYIEYTILKRLIKLENPTGSIYQYINASNLLDFYDEELHFKNDFLLSTKRKRKWKYFLTLLGAIFCFIFSFLSFVYCFGIFSQKDYELSELVISFILGVFFLYPFITITNDAIRISDAEKLIKNFNKKSICPYPTSIDKV